MPIATGAKLGQYEVQDFIGQGAMGLVYRAYHPQLERTCAVKVMQAITPDADTVARFRHEAQAIAQMRHPNIVNVYDFGEYQGTPYMIVEYVPGGSLADRMNEGMLEQRAAIKYLRGIAAGLDYAHGHGVVHRDVKPANVLMTAEDTPVLADFGLAKLLQGSSLKSMTGVTTGTPAYMAPEQVTGNKVGPAADRYSLATIAYEMLTGVIPFDGEALMELLYAQVHRQPQLPSSRKPSLGPDVDAVIMRGLAKDPAARWGSCSSFVEALAAALAAAPKPGAAKTMVMAPAVVSSTVPLAASGMAAAVAEIPQRAAAMAFPPPPAPPAPVMTLQKRGSRKPLAVVAGALVVLLLLLVLVGWTLAHLAPTLSLSSYTVAPGESIVVSASHVPANQAGEIQLWSVLHTYSFRASASGDVSLDITLPRDVGLGDHLVKICWSGACHAQTTLHVVSLGAFGSPTPAASTSPGVTPTPYPTSYPTSTPKSTPTSTPTPSPYVTAETISKANGFYVTMHFFGGGTWAISVVQLGKTYAAGTTTVPTGSTYYTAHFPTPTQVASSQQAFVVACNSGARCFESHAVTVGP